MDDKIATSSEEPTPTPTPTSTTEPAEAVQPVTPVTQPTPAPQPVIAPVQSVAVAKDEMSLARKINRAMALVLIFSGISFVLITILAIWEVFGKDAGTVVWRSLGSLGAIALGALIISVASKIIDESHHK